MTDIFAPDKILSHPDKVHTWMQGGLETLVTAELDMTNKCNSRCPKCSGGRTNESSLSKEQAFSIVWQLADFGVRGLVLTGGGEPSLNPHTPRVIQYASNLGLDVGIITNGIELSDDLMHTISKYCTWCRVSLDARTREGYEKTHGLGGDDFDRVVSNTKRLVGLRNRLNSPCTIGNGFLTGTDTVGAILPFTLLSKEMGVDYVQFRPFHYDTTPIDRELEEARKHETEDFKVLSLEYKYGHFNEPRPYDKCYSCDFVGVITADYKLSTCCHTKGIDEFTLGDLNENSFREIWDSKRRRKILDGIDPAKCVPLCRINAIKYFSSSF